MPASKPVVRNHNRESAGIRSTRSYAIRFASSIAATAAHGCEPGTASNLTATLGILTEARLSAKRPRVTALTMVRAAVTLLSCVEGRVVGRDEPLARLEGFIQALRGGPGCLVIEGEAGIGKTTLWQTAVGAASERGYRVLVSRPAESETGLAYSGLADLLADVDSVCLNVLPDPQRHALDVALLRSEPTGRPPAPRAIFTAFGAVLQSLSRDAPVLIAVDDLQWLDMSSQRMLEFVSRRFGDEPVGILATVRLGSRSSAVELAGAVPLRLGAVSVAVLHDLIRSQAGVSLPRSTVLRVHRMTGGNPFFALQLARVLVDADLPGPSDPWPVPEDLGEMVRDRVGLLPGSVRSALLVAAASARPTISGLSTQAIRTAERAAIVTTGQHGRVRFAHPLYASAIYEGAAPEARRRVHAALATTEADVEERARHRALASNGPDEEVAALLDEAAARARARGAPDLAAELEERASSLTPPDRPERAWQRRLAAAEHHFHAGDLERARNLLLELVEAAKPGPPRSRALLLLGEACFYLGALDDSLRYLRYAIDAAEGDLASIAEAEVEIAWVLSRSLGSFDDVAAAAARALAAAEELGDDRLLSFSLATSTATDFFVRGRPLDEEKLARALALEDLDWPSPIERRPSFILGWMLRMSEQLDRARELLEALRARLVERGEECDLPELLGVMAHVECVAGNLDAASALADRGYDLAQQARSDSLAAATRSVRALVDAHAGRVEETRAKAAEAIDAGRP